MLTAFLPTERSWLTLAGMGLIWITPSAATLANTNLRITQTELLLPPRGAARTVGKSRQ